MQANHLYVHVPFCARRCVYCDFSIAVRSRVPVDDYLGALEHELTRHADSNFDLETLYFGGGTPSKLGGEGVVRLLDILRKRDNLRLRDDAEVTLEANPEDVTPTAVRAWRTAGVNRLSLGVQSFDDSVLAEMHRTHDAATAKRAIAVARDEGLSNVSVDLIFALPWSGDRRWIRELEAVLELDLPHVSVYGLTVEPRTPLGRWVAAGKVRESPEDTFERDFLEARRELIGASYEHYEVSNYGKAGAQSRHNWAYWRRRAYGGVGPSAHEFDGRSRRWNVDAYADWATRVGRDEDPLSGAEELSHEQRVAEEVYLALRTNAGLRLEAPEHESIAAWVSAKWAEVRDSTLYLTGEGWLRLDALATRLTMLRSR